MNKVENINQNNNDTVKKINKRSTIGSIIGVSAGLIASIALSKKAMPIKDVFVKGDFQKSAKNLYNYTRVDYEGFKGFLSMVFQASGAAFGSLIGALSVKNNDKSTDENDLNKKAKIKEAIFMTNNVLIPTALVKGGEFGLEKLAQSAKSTNIQNFASNKITKSLAVILGLVGGMITSMSVTNTINNKFIEKEKSTDKKMKPLDFIYHVDDIIPILVSSKNPICQKLPIDRLLPVIYGFMGSKVGKSNHGENHHHH